VFEINYDNEINKFNQIGIIGLEFFGEEISQNKLKIMKLQEEIANLEIIKKKAVEDENYDLAKETNNQIMQKKELIQKLKEGKDMNIDNLDNIIKEENEIKDNDKKEKNNDKEIKKQNEPKEITIDDGGVKRYVNRKKNVEKISTGVSTNEKDINMRYNKKSSSDIKPIDVDQQKVGNTLTFSQMVEKELSSNSQFSPYNNNSPNINLGIKKANNKKDIISDEDKDFINLINQFIPEETLMLLISKNVKEIEKAINNIYEDLLLYNDDKEYTIFINGISINDIVFTCSNICLYILKTNYIPPKIMVIDIMNVFLNNSKYIEIIQAIKEFGECFVSLLDYLGDSNQKLREKSEKIIFEYTKKTKSQNKIINLIINTPIKKNLIKSRNHLNGRYLMVSKIVYLGGYFKNNFENILKYALNGYALNKINVRDAALEIIITLYKYEGDRVHQYFQDSGLRPAQIKTIQDKLDEIEINNNKKNNDIINQNPNLINACEFCGYYKPNITKDELNIHQYKDCPMLMQCDNCKQIIEISNLNNHLLNECDFKEKYIKCNRCKQVVEKETLNDHQISENCFDVNEDKEKLCPLCHLNIITEDIWKLHFLENGCQANDRIATPSTTNASNFNFNK
jgi:hypothetical protein